MCYEHIVNILLQQENKQLKEKIKQLETNRDEVIECINEFLCTEEYIKVDGLAIANNYTEIVIKLEKGKE